MGGDIIDNPGLLEGQLNDRKQVIPILGNNDKVQRRRYLKELFDNSTIRYEHQRLITEVTGYSGTVRVRHTTDESRIYPSKRIIGINGINIPVINSDALNRT